MHLGLKYWPFVPHIESWEPCGFTEAPDGAHAYNLNILRESDITKSVDGYKGRY